MDKSILYDNLSATIISEWREEAEKEYNGECIKTENESKNELLNVLPKKYKDTLNAYALAIEERMDNVHYKLHIKILNLGIQLGMQLQKSFINSDED